MASNWTEFSAALAQWCWPTQNLVYADDQGHIAYHAIGAVPIRPAGLIDVPIADNAHEWQGYIPFDAMPNAVDPPSGFLATANSRVTTDKSPYPLTDDWIDPYRIERIYKIARRPRPAHAHRHARRANRHLQRSGSGDGPALCLCHRPHARS